MCNRLVVLAVRYRLRATGVVESVPHDEYRHLYPAVGYRYSHTVATQPLVVQEDACIMIETKKEGSAPENRI